MIDIGIFPVVSAWMRRLDVTVFVALAFLMASQTALAEGGLGGNPGDPRSNVNLIGMTPDPADFPDRRYRQQNEPACAIRPGDSACIICAYNDYRGVDLDIGFGDSWQGVSQSCDAGDTWLSRLAPGYPGDLDADQIAAEFTADPRLAAIPGLAIFNFIGGFRDSNVGVLAIQHWLEVNKEDADYYEPGRQTYIADEGTSGRFLDKPDMLAVLDPPGRQGTIELTTIMENPALGVDGVITRQFPTGTLYIAYAAFTGSNSIKVLVKTSTDWGRTFKNQVLKLSEDQNQVSGITLTALGDKVLAVWRRKGDGNDPDSILYSIITNGGKQATKGEVLADICAFDQPTLTGSETDLNVVTFRTNDFPWTATDGHNVFVFYSDRARDTDGACLTDLEGNPNGNPRIVMHHSDLSGPVNWTDYGPIDQTATPDTFQFMPTAFGANGKVQVAWYDTRRDPSDPLALPFVADYDALYAGSGFLVNRTVDVFTTKITMIGAVPNIPNPVRASQFSIRVGIDELTLTRTEYETEALLANKKLFAQGKAPFLGDYIAMAAREYRRNSTDTAWESNASAVVNGNEDFFVAWTDNRDVRGVIGDVRAELGYSYDLNASANLQEEVSDEETDAEQLVADIGPPRDSSMIAEGIDGSDPAAAAVGLCSADTSRTRDSNIYGSLIKDQARIYAPNPSKPLGGLQRAFPVVISNSGEDPKSYKLKIVPGSCLGGGCQASFRQQPLLSAPVYDEPIAGSPSPFLLVPAKSSIARTVFVVGDQSPVKVEARDDAGTLLATIQLANAPRFRDPENCDAAKTNCSVASNELHNLELKTVDVHLLDLLTPGDELDAIPILSSGDVDASSLVAWAVAGGCCDGESPASLGSVIEYAVENLADETVQIDANLLNAALLNAALLNANLLNANLLNAALLNAALLNANLLNGSPTDLSILGGPDSPLVTAAIADGCCVPEIEPTVGSIIVWNVNNPEIINASLLNAALLNAALLNANLLNANLLNANLLNANLLNANLLNANLLNASLLNAALLNPDVEAAALLNANLLNADLLNANLLNPTMVALALEGGCCDPATDPTAVDVIIYAVGHPEIINASLLNAALLNANLLNANLLNANLLNANLLNANLLNADLLNANLLNADLLNANLLNANLLNADLLNANLLNANLLNPSVYDTNTGTVNVYDEDTGTVTPSSTVPVTFDDYTYPITNNGNVTTAVDADITINAPIITVDGVEVMDVIGTKLIIWTANATPTVVDCVERVQLNTRVQSITTTDPSFEVADINNPFKGQASAVVAPGETVFVTLRVVGTSNQLKNVRVNGFTASSQAANCYDTVSGPQCDTQLNDGVEQITFADLEPPIITVPADLTVEADSASGTVVDYTATVFDAADANPTLDCMPESGYEFPIGTTPVSCNATDASGNAADTASFSVKVQDTIVPVITLTPNVLNVTLEVGVDPYIAPVATVTDAGNSTASVVVGGVVVDPNKVGTYVVTYDAFDGYNDAATVTYTVYVVDTTAPVITLDPNVLNVTLEVGVDPYIAPVATVTDAGNSTASVVVGGVVVDPNKVGTYVVTYDAFDGYNDAATVTYTVYVVDTTAPVITLNPDNPQTIEAGAPYEELGATASDLGGISLPISIDATGVDTNKVGSYAVTYDVTDSQGNPAMQVIRTVNVVDSFDPVIIIDSNWPDFTPDGPFILDPDALDPTTVTITWPVSAQDLVGISIRCEIVPSGETIPSTDNYDTATNTLTTTFTYPFGVGTTDVSCVAIDQGLNESLPATFEVVVEDRPTIIATSNPLVVQTDDGDGFTATVFESDLIDNLTVADLFPQNGDLTVTCPTIGSLGFAEFGIGSYDIACTVTDSRGFSADTTFSLSVQYRYEVDLVPPKGRARAGSTVPLDWQYLENNVVIDSSAFMVGVIWEKTDERTSSSQSCTDLTPASTDGSSFIRDADSGNSDFRYSSSDNIWQFSWQTPDALGWHRVSVLPPGGDVDGAWSCINLR